MTEMMITANTNVPAFTNKKLQEATNTVFKIGETVRKCAFETAYIMAQVESSECFKEDGFNSVHDWAMKTFGFKKSASYTLLRVGKEYTRALVNDKGRVTEYRSNLVPENSETDFCTSQIEKILPIGHDEAVKLVDTEIITPDMTCKEIEKIIKTYTNPETDEPETDEPETDEPEIAESDIIVTDENGVKYAIPQSILAQYRLK